MTERGSPLDRRHVLGGVVGIALIAVAVIGVPQLSGASLSPAAVRTIQYGLYLTVFALWMAWFVSVSVSVWHWVDRQEDAEC
jgi:hypothetical protein